MTVTFVDLTTLTETITFSVLGTTSPAWAASAPTSFSIWPTTQKPDALSDQDVIQGAGYGLSLASGELFSGYTLPAYNPGVPPISLVYSSMAADPRPIFVERFEIDPSQAVPTQVKAKLTLNGVAGSEIWYDTSTLIPGDIMQIALQGDATGLATGRYNYQIDVTAMYGTPVTTTRTGQVNIVNLNNSAFGAGWSLANVQRIHAVTGGVILELPGGQSLWFADSTPNNYTTPAGDPLFSTLVKNGDNTWTRTLKDGVKINFATDGRQSSIVDRNNNTISFTWSAGNLVTITDPNSLQTQLAYTSGKLTSITDPASRVTGFAYTSGRLASITAPDPDGGGPLASPIVGYGYDSANRMTSRTNERNFTTTFSYDFANRVGTVTRPGSITESLTALQLRGLAQSPQGTQANPAPATLAVAATAAYTDPRTNVWNTRLDWLGFGRASQPENPLGQMAVFHRNANGMMWLAADPLSRRTRFHLDSKANPTKIALPDDNYQEFTYNSFSQPLTMRDARGFTTTVVYDTNGNPTSITQPDPDGPNPLESPVWTFTYKSDGWLETETNPLTRTTTYGYDTRDRVTTITYADSDGDPNNNPKVLFGYDSASNVTTRTDERSFTTTFVSDKLNRLTNTTLPDNDGNPSNNPLLTYSYDAASNLTAVTDPLNHTWTTTYDSLNRLSTATSPLSHTATYTYDGASNVIAVTDPLSRTTSFGYDTANRNTTITQPDPDGGGPLTSPVWSFGYDAAGQLTSRTNPLNKTWSYAYNVRGWVGTETDPLNNVVSYAYDANGNMGAIQSMIAQSNMTYDNLNRRLSYRDPNLNLTQWAYDAAGQVISETNGLLYTTSFSYTPRNWLATVTQPDPDAGGPLTSPVTTFSYDAAGNRVTVADPLNRLTTTVYDAQNRPTSITDPRGGITTLTYDLAGRTTSLTDPVNNVTTWTYDNANRKTGEIDPLNRTIGYQYDNADQLTQITDRRGLKRQFIYDNVGRQTQEKWVDTGGATVRTATAG